MKKMKYDSKINFVVPTPWRDPYGEHKCVNDLAKHANSLGLDYKVYFVCNEWDLKPEFQQLQFDDDNIILLGHNMNYSISKSVNMVIDKSKDVDYVCFVQSDVHFDTANWLVNCIDVCSSYDKIGIIGFQKHSIASRIDEIPFATESGCEFLKTPFSDGIMFFTTDLMNNIGRFDESYFGDKESQDYCYRANNDGYHNLRMLSNSNEIHHNQLPFNRKTNTNTELYLQSVANSKELFNTQWCDSDITW